MAQVMVKGRLVRRAARPCLSSTSRRRLKSLRPGTVASSRVGPLLLLGDYQQRETPLCRKLPCRVRGLVVEYISCVSAFARLNHQTP